MQVVIVRSCRTSRGDIVCEVPGGTRDSEPLDLPEIEALNLIADGHARLPPPLPAVEPEPAAPVPVEPEPAPLEQETEQ